MSKVRLEFSDSKSTLNEDNELLSATSTQSVEFTADSVLIKKERLGESKHGEIFKGERVSMYSELGIQPVLINEINLSENPRQGTQFFHERISAPLLGFSKYSPHIAKCFGFHFNSKGTKIWLVTEFLPYSVHDLIESGPLEEQQIAFIVAEVIRGLAHLHSLGIQHGNIVSNQVMLTPSGEVKLAGFHLAADTLDAVQLPKTLDSEDSGFKDDILSLGKMAVELVHGPQISGEHPLVEKEIPSLLNRFSKNFRGVITSCLQKYPNDRPTAAQLLNHPFIKKMKKTTLKDHKLLFNRCKRFKRSLTRRKSRNHAQSKSITKQPSKSVNTILEYEEANGDNSCSSLNPPGGATHFYLQTEEPCETGTSDLPVATWDFRHKSLAQAQESQQSEHNQFTINFRTITVIFEERINKDTISGEKIFKGTFKDGDQDSISCLVREVDLSKLSKNAAIVICHEAVSPILQISSSNVVKVLHMGFSRDLDSEPHQDGARLYIVTEFFLDSVHDLQDTGPLEEELIAWILREVLKGLDYLHSQRIAYGNLTSQHILFSIASGSLEIKLDHSHTVRDELDDRKVSSVSTANFDLVSKADIWNLGIIATELVHATQIPNDFSHSTEEQAAVLPSHYSKSFNNFVASCLHSSTQTKPTAHELLQFQFIKEAKEMCGLEGVFELYWQLKLKKDKQLRDKITNGLESDLTEDVQVLPNVSWSFDEVSHGLSSAPQPITPQQSINDLNLNQMKDASKPQELMSQNHQTTEESIFTQQIQSELSSHDEPVSTPLQQRQGSGAFQSSPIPGPASEQQPMQSRTKHKYGHREQDHTSPRLSFYGQPSTPPHFQATPWWMYPPWWLPPPWWLHPPPPPPPHPPPMASSGHHRNLNPPGQGFHPRPPWWQHPHTTHSTVNGQREHENPLGEGSHPPWSSHRNPVHPMDERQLRPSQPNQMQRQPWWSYQPYAWAPWQHPQKQTPPQDGQLHGYTSSMELRHDHLLHQSRDEEDHQLQESQDQLPFKQPVTAAEYRPQTENALSEQLRSTAVTDNHAVLHMNPDTKELPPLRSRDEGEFPPQSSDSQTQELRYKEVLAQHLPLIQPTVDADHLGIDDKPLAHTLQLPPSTGNLAQEVMLVQEMPLLELAMDDNMLVLEEATMSLEDEQSTSIKEERMPSPEPLPPEQTEEYFVQRVDRMEQLIPQLTLDEHLLQGEDGTATEVRHPTTDIHQQQYKDLQSQELQRNDEIQPLQPLYQEQPLPQPTPNDLLLQSNSRVKQAPSQQDHDELEQAKHKDPLVRELQPRADNHAALQDDSESEVSPTLCLTVDDYPCQQRDPSIKESHPIGDNHSLRVENEGIIQDQKLLQKQPEELAQPMAGDKSSHYVMVEESQQTVDHVMVDESQQTVDDVMVDESQQTVDDVMIDESQQTVDDVMVDESQQTVDDVMIEESQQTVDDVMVDESQQTVDDHPIEHEEQDQKKDLPLEHLPLLPSAIADHQPLQRYPSMEASPPITVFQSSVDEYPHHEDLPGQEQQPAVDLVESEVHKEQLPATNYLPMQGEDQQEQHPSLPTADDLLLGTNRQTEPHTHPEVGNQLEQHPLLLLDNNLQPQSEDYSLLMTANILLQTEQQVKQLPSPTTDEDFHLLGEEQPEPHPSLPPADDLPLQTDNEPNKHPPQPQEGDGTSIEDEDQLEQHAFQNLLPVDNLSIQSENQREQPPLISQPSEDHSQHHEEPEMRETPSMGDGHPSQYEELLLGRDQHSPQPVEEVEENFYTLQDLVKVKPLEEHQAAAILLKLVQILDHLHSQGKAHSNITIGNIVISESGEIKLADFNVIESVITVVLKAKQFVDDDDKADIWSLGISAVEMVNGEPPDANMLELLLANSSITPQFLDNQEFSDDFEDFISNCLKVDPKERLSAVELLEHDFLTSANADASVVAKTLISQYKDCASTHSQPVDGSIQEIHPLLLTPDESQVEKMDLLSQEQPGDDIQAPQKEGILNPLLSQAMATDDLPNPPEPLSMEDQVEHESSLVHTSYDCLTPKQDEMLDQDPLQSPLIPEDHQPQSGNDHLESYPYQLTLGENQVNLVAEKELATTVDHHEILQENSLLEEVLTLLDQSTAVDHQLSQHDGLMVEESQIKTSDILEEAKVGVDPILDHHLVDNQSFQPIEETAVTHEYSLQELIKAHPLREKQAAAVLLKVVQILDELHSQGKVHNDITIANIILSESGEIKLVESEAIDSVLSIVPKYSPLADFDKADIWSLGITAVEMANGEPPDANMLDLLFANSFVTPQFLDDEVHSDEFEDFISSCLKSDPDERSSTEELLEHEFLVSASPDTVEINNTLITQYRLWRKSQLGTNDEECRLRAQN